MKSVFKLSSGHMTLLAAIGLAAGFTPAAAADLGGDCCADLEERVAELEATTARKGNRKVSLTISGWVNESAVWWDNGFNASPGGGVPGRAESNAYIGTNSLEQSRFRFVGEAKIDADWSAGYVLEIGVQGDPSQRWNAASPGSSDPNPSNGNNALLVRKSNWFLKSKTYGQIAVGMNGTATYHLLDDADFTQTRNFADAEAPAVYMSAFLTSQTVANGGVKWSDALRGFNNATPGQSGRRNVIRYDTPTIAGFTGTAAWGEDDIWDMALTYKGDIGDFSVVGKVGYGESSDQGAVIGVTGLGLPTYIVGGTTCISGSSLANVNPGFSCKWGGAAATVMHKPTGLYAFGGWGKQSIDDPGKATLVDPDSTMWFIQAGIEQKWTPLGKTTIFGHYRHDDAGTNIGKTISSDLSFWQVGMIQGVDAAAMNLYLIYQHADGSTVLTKGAASTDLESFQEVIAGAMIQF